MTINSNQPLQVNQLSSSLEMPKDYEDFREVISLYLKRIADAVNKKTGSLFYLQEIGNLESYFTSGMPFVFRDVYRYCFDLIALNGGNIAGGASVTFPHGIVGFKYGTLIYVTATDTNGLSFTATYPYSSIDATNIYFTNPEGGVALVEAVFVAQYLKD